MKPTCRAWTHGGVETVFVAFAITIAAALCLVTFKHVPIGRYSTDFIAILDGGYRIEQGQWPHIDFAVPHGAWPLLQGWIALELHPWLVPFLTYQMTQWLTVLPIAVYVAAIQQTRFRAVSVLAIAAVATLIPYVIEAENIAGFSYYAGYNRLTTALLFLVFVWAQTPRRLAWADSVLVVAMLFVLLATKITGFVVGLGLVSIAALLSPVKRAILLRAFCLLALILVALEIATGLPLAYLSDIRAMLAVNKGGLAYFAGSLAIRALPAVIAAAALCLSVCNRADLALSRVAIVHPIALLRSRRALLMMIAVFAGTIAAESQNTGSLLLAASIAVAFWPLSQRHTSAAFVRAAKVGLVVAVLTPWWGSIVHRGFIVATREARQLVSEPGFAILLPGTMATESDSHIAGDLVGVWNSPAPPLSLLAGAADVEPAAVVALVRTIDEAATEAVRRGLVTPDTRVMTVAGIDFFARRLGARSPSGTNLWQDLERTFGARSVEELRDYLRNVDAAFMRRCEVDPVYIRLNALFEPAFHPDFVRVDLTSCWSIWSRQTRSKDTARARITNDSRQAQYHP